MFSRCLEGCAALLLLSATAQAGDLRVCADPDNLPFSNKKEEGYENRIAALVAADLGAKLVYVWADERRATALEVMNQGRCDLVPGMIAQAPGVATTRPYMRSSYAFVTRSAPVSSFDDPQLRKLRIGVQSVGDDSVTPPVEALLHRGLNANIQPFTFHGSAADPNSAGVIVQAVARKDIDAAVLWGPFAGFFAARQDAPLQVSVAQGSPRDPPMSFAISMATRRQDVALRDAVDSALAKHRDEIAALLKDYHVPLLPVEEGEAAP